MFNVLAVVASVTMLRRQTSETRGPNQLDRPDLIVDQEEHAVLRGELSLHHVILV
jgi:hypothetical protein